MTKDEFAKLQQGNIVRGKTSAESYIVTANYGNRVTAVRTIDLTNPDEWLLIPATSLDSAMLDKGSLNEN